MGTSINLHVNFYKSFGISLGFLKLSTLNIWWLKAKKYYMSNNFESVYLIF